MSLKTERAAELDGRHFIDGKRVESSDKGTFETVNPATGETLAEVARGGDWEVDLAVRAAKQAYAEEWLPLGAAERGELMRAWASLVSQSSEELAALESADCGKAITDSRGSVARGAKMLEFFAGVTDKLFGTQIPVGGEMLNYTLDEAYGVVGAIIPWNYPSTNFLTKAAPALACGNALVVKPAEQAPLLATRMAELAVEAGIPSGVLNVVNGFGEEAGRALVVHPNVPKIAFTGSSRVGLEITRSTGETLKSFTLELGGKSPNVIFADADREQAVKAAAFTCFMNQGQTCTAATRLLVEDSIADDFLAELKEYASAIKVGDPSSEETQIGALVSAEQLEHALRYVEAGKEEGARLVAGGRRIRPEDFENGFFLEPTILDEVTPDMTVFREEIFGPVMSVTRFSGYDEAMRIANDTDYGLAATVWTTDLRKAHRAARDIEAGLVWVNTVHSLHAASPYGGYKQSGIGTEMGFEIAYEYMRRKSAWVNYGSWQSPWG